MKQPRCHCVWYELPLKRCMYYLEFPSQHLSYLFRWGRTFPGRVQLLNKRHIHCTGWTSVMFCANVLFERTCALFSKESGKLLHLCICPFETARFCTHTHTHTSKKSKCYMQATIWHAFFTRAGWWSQYKGNPPTIPTLVNITTPNAMLPQLPRSWTSCQMPFQCSCLVFSVKLVTFQTPLHTPHLIIWRKLLKVEHFTQSWLIHRYRVKYFRSKILSVPATALPALWKSWLYTQDDLQHTA